MLMFFVVFGFSTVVYAGPCQVLFWQSDGMDGEKSASNKVQPNAMRPDIPVLVETRNCSGESAAWLVEKDDGVSYVDRQQSGDTTANHTHDLPPPNHIQAISVMVGKKKDLPTTVGQWRSSNIPFTRILLRLAK